MFDKMTLAGAVLAGLIAAPAMAVPVNDLIGDAIDLGGTTGSIMGTTIDATIDSGAPFAGTAITSPGVWYTMIGAGGAQNLSTCNDASYDTKISVYADYDGVSLGSLTAIAGQDDAPGCSGFTTDLTFGSDLGETYWILVHGFGGESGTFTLSYESDTSQVPLPASAVLLAAALGGLGLRSRMRAR